ERKSRTTPSKPSSHPTRKPVARSVPASESKPASKWLSPELKHDNVQIINKSVIDDCSADDDDDFKDDINSNASVVEGERVAKTKPSLGKQISQAGSDMSIKTDCTTDTKVIEKEPPKKRPRGNSDSSDDEDVYSSSGSGDDFDSESDFGDKNCVVVIGKKKDTKVVKKTTAATASKKPVAKPTPTKTVRPISARTTSIASRPAPKKPVALTSKPLTPLSPTLPRRVRPPLSSSGSSLTLAPTSPRKIGGGGLRGGRNNASLSSLLGGSGPRRVGLTRTKPVAKKD
ncbi:hypothetical protein LPJ73_002629, partial [Coemansia sp. RSA 2703]